MRRGSGLAARLLVSAALALALAPATAAGPQADAAATPAAAGADGPAVASTVGAGDAGDLTHATTLATVVADAPPAAAATTATAQEAPRPAAIPARTTNGVAIYERFVEGLSQPACEGASPRWRAHFAHVPEQLAAGDSELLPLFGYVVEALRSAHLPTEYALIPFVESGYRPGARSQGGPAGLWQFMAITARDHGIPIRGNYDGRLSPVDATRAAVRYLKTLHGMFAGDWRLAVMAFNAGEYRVLAALRRHGQRPADANPAALDSLAGITRAYVRKLHALSCLMVEAGADQAWTDSLDRPVSRLVAVDLAGEPAGLEGYARRNGLDPVRLKRLNPSHARGGLAGQRILVPVAAVPGPAVPAVAN